MYVALYIALDKKLKYKWRLNYLLVQVA